MKLAWFHLLHLGKYDVTDVCVLLLTYLYTDTKIIFKHLLSFSGSRGAPLQQGHKLCHQQMPARHDPFYPCAGPGWRRADQGPLQAAHSADLRSA